MGDIEKLCYDYAFHGYLLGIIKGLAKSDKEIEGLLNEFNKIKMLDHLRKEISNRLDNFLDKTCSKCNSKLGSNDKFCSKCGAKKNKDKV